MQSVIVEKPYEFIGPRFSAFWLRIVRLILPWKLKKDFGVGAIECVGVEKLRASLDAGHGVMLVSNHCRPCDPMVLDSLAKTVERPFHCLASWHVFMFGKIQRFLLPRMGAFSVYREGLDRESLKCSVSTIAEGRFPLVIFAEGIITRCNDWLANFMDGPAFMGRAAAKQRKDRRVVIHPIFIRYFFEGNLEETVLPVVGEIERRFSWQPQVQLPLRERIGKIGEALLGLKEMEYFNAVQSGTFQERLSRLEDHLLRPLEDRWSPGRHDGGSMARVKRLRTAILPDLVSGNLTEEERALRWRSFADLYLVQQLHCYPGGYLDEATAERILETIERYEEDLTDKARPHFPIRAVIFVGDAIEVGATRDRSQEHDPITSELREKMEALMESSKSFRKIQPEGIR